MGQPYINPTRTGDKMEVNQLAKGKGKAQAQEVQEALQALQVQDIKGITTETETTPTGTDKAIKRNLSFGELMDLVPTTLTNRTGEGIITSNGSRLNTLDIYNQRGNLSKVNGFITTNGLYLAGYMESDRVERHGFSKAFPNLPSWSNWQKLRVKDWQETGVIYTFSYGPHTIHGLLIIPLGQDLTLPLGRGGTEGSKVLQVGQGLALILTSNGRLFKVARNQSGLYRYYYGGSHQPGDYHQSDIGNFGFTMENGFLEVHTSGSDIHHIKVSEGETVDTYLNGDKDIYSLTQVKDSPLPTQAILSSVKEWKVTLNTED